MKGHPEEWAYHDVEEFSDKLSAIELETDQYFPAASCTPSYVDEDEVRHRVRKMANSVNYITRTTFGLIKFKIYES